MSLNTRISKRAKLTGIERFFQDTRQDERTSSTDGHSSSFLNISQLPEQPRVEPIPESINPAIVDSFQCSATNIAILSLSNDFDSSKRPNSISNSFSLSESSESIHLTLEANELHPHDMATSDSANFLCPNRSPVSAGTSRKQAKYRV